MEQNNNGKTMKPNRDYMKCAAGLGLGNENDKAVLGYLITQTFTGVYAENGCIAVPDERLSLRTGIATSTVRDTVNRLVTRGYIEVERPKVRKRGLATRYKICQRVMDKVAARNGGKAANIVKRNENMDQDNELKRQIQSLQAENGELRLQLEELKKAKAPEASDKDKRIAELEARLKNAIKWWNANKGVFEKVKALEAENAELKKAGPNVSDEDLKRENEKLRRDKDESVRKEKAAVRESFNERQKNSMQKEEINRLKRYEKVFNSLVYQGIIDQNGNPVGQDMVTVEAGVPYNSMRVDEFMEHLSTIKNKN